MQQKEYEEEASLILDIILTSVWKDWWKPWQPLSISGVCPLIWTHNIPNIKQDCYMTTNILQKMLFCLCWIFWWDTTLTQIHFLLSQIKKLINKNACPEKQGIKANSST